MRSFFVVASSLVLASSLVHCTAGTTSTTGGSDASVRNPACPDTEPTAGAACGLAEGTMCNNYPGREAPGCECCGGGGGGYQCTGGKWVAFASAGGGAPSIAAVCPITVPKQGDSCGPQCGGALLSCDYDCAHGNGYVSSATCNGGVWQVNQSLAPCEAQDGGDGGGGDASDAG